MKKHLLLFGFIICSFAGFSQTLSGFFPNGMPGYKYTMQNQYYAHPLYAINDSTAGFDSTGYYVQSFGRNTTNDSIILSFLNGRRLAVLAGSATGGGGTATAAGSNTQVQYNASGSFGASPFFTYNPTSTATSGVARNLYVGNGTLSPSATGDVMVGVDIGNPNFSNGTGLASTSQYAVRVGGGVNFSGTFYPLTLINGASNIGAGFLVHRQLTGGFVYGSYFNDSLIASANGATMVGVRILPVFADNGFTGVTHNALQVSNGNSDFLSITANSEILGSGGLQVGTSYPRIFAFQYGLPTIEFSSSNGTTLVGQAASNDDGITGTLKNDFFTSMRYSTSTYYIGSGTTRRFGFTPNGGMIFFTAASEPATPAAGSVVEWFDGTSKKVKYDNGTIDVIYTKH